MIFKRNEANDECTIQGKYKFYCPRSKFQRLFHLDVRVEISARRKRLTRLVAELVKWLFALRFSKFSGTPCC